MSENTFHSSKWGNLTFIPTRSGKWKDTCCHCPLWVQKDRQTDRDECLRARCTPEERKDKQHGYFSLQQWPQTQK